MRCSTRENCAPATPSVITIIITNSDGYAKATAASTNWKDLPSPLFISSMSIADISVVDVLRCVRVCIASASAKRACVCLCKYFFFFLFNWGGWVRCVCRHAAAASIMGTRGTEDNSEYTATHRCHPFRCISRSFLDCNAHARSLARTHRVSGLFCSEERHDDDDDSTSTAVI